MRAWVVIAVAVIIASGCQADEHDLRGLPPPCADGWRACAGECIREDEACGPVAYTSSASAAFDICPDLPLDVTMPNATSSVLLVAGCLRFPTIDTPSPIAVSYAGVPLIDLASTISRDDPDGDYYYRSVLFWGPGLPAGAGQVSITGTGGTPCAFTAVAYSGASADRPDYHGAATEAGSATVTVASAPDELPVASLCLKSYSTTPLTLLDDPGQTRRHVQPDDSTFAALADKPGAAPTVELGWFDLAMPAAQDRRSAVSAVSLSPYCPTCVGAPAATALPRPGLGADDFERPDSPDLGGAWTSGFAGTNQFLEIASGRVRTNTATGNSVATYNAETMPDDQWASIGIAAVVGDGRVSALVRSETATDVYAYTCAASSRGFFDFSTIISELGSGSLLAGSNSVSWLPGDTLRCEADGPVLRVVRIADGVESLVLSATDWTYSSGRSGIDIFAWTISTPPNAEIEDFATGTFGP